MLSVLALPQSCATCFWGGRHWLPGISWTISVGGQGRNHVLLWLVLSVWGKILCSPPGSHQVLSRQSLVSSSKTQRVVSIFSLNGRNKCFPKCHCMILLHNWQSGNTCTQYKNQNTPLLGCAGGLKVIRPFSWFLLPVCQPHQNTSWAPARLTFMCKHQRKSL